MNCASTKTIMTIRIKYSSLRLKGYDYSESGAYFVTLCRKNQIGYFENIESKNIMAEAWGMLPERFPTITLDEFTVMPYHLHFIIWLDPEVVGPIAPRGPMILNIDSEKSNRLLAGEIPLTNIALH